MIIEKNKIPPHLLKYFKLKEKKTIIHRGYISHLCDIFDEVKRVLKKTGSCWVNMGSVIVSKCDLMIPERFAIEMIARGWIKRRTVIWHKPNCIPSSVKDDFTQDFEYLYRFVKRRKYYFEQQFEPLAEETFKRAKHGFFSEKTEKYAGLTIKRVREYYNKVDANKIQGRNKRCVWTIATKGYSGAHFAVFPETLIETPIKAGCPEFVCKKCGKAREAIIEINLNKFKPRENEKYLGGSEFFSKKTRLRSEIERRNSGYTDCGCNAGFEKGIVLDPFIGAGTTAVVAQKLNRHYIGIELNPEYIELAEKRLENFS